MHKPPSTAYDKETFFTYAFQQCTFSYRTHLAKERCMKWLFVKLWQALLCLTWHLCPVRIFALSMTKIFFGATYCLCKSKYTIAMCPPHPPVEKTENLPSL
jgi:hypothetical protein